MLFDRHDPGTVAGLLHGFGIGDQRGYAVRVAGSADPLTDGYLRCLRFVPAAPDAQTAGIADIMTAFVAEEVRRHLAGIDLGPAGGRPDPHTGGRPTVLSLVDYPAFDNGTIDIGFGLLLNGDAGRRHLRLWSRLLHHHK